MFFLIIKMVMDRILKSNLSKRYLDPFANFSLFFFGQFQTVCTFQYINIFWIRINYFEKELIKVKP